MKKKYIFLIIFVLLFNCCFINKVSAKTYSCVYNGGDLDIKGQGDTENEDGDAKVVLEVDTVANTISVTDKTLNVSSNIFGTIFGSVIGSAFGPYGSGLGSILGKNISNYFSELKDADELLNNTSQNSYVKNYLKGKCPPKITIMIFRNATPGIDDWFAGYLLNDDLIYSGKNVFTGYEIMSKKNLDYTDYDYCAIKDRKFNCYDNDYMVTWMLNEEESDEEAGEMNFPCSTYNKYYDQGKSGIKNLFEKYTKQCKNKSNKDNEKCSEIMSEYNKKLSMLKGFCSNVINYRDSASTCMNECLTLQETIAKLTKNSEKRACYLSQEIVAFVYNILKWIKYIAPVIVIILSILDFIKAIAAQDDDAMKKAQGKFVKRLIAAALLFLLPLIIDYLLDVFNLNNESCNINNIFK